MGVFDTIPEHTPGIKNVNIDVKGTSTSLKMDVSRSPSHHKSVRLNWPDLSAETKSHLTALPALLKADYIAKEQGTP